MSDVLYRVYVEYPMELGRDAMDRAIRHAAGRDFGFSGAGMGMRDVGWHFGSEIEAARVSRSLKAIGLSPVMKCIEETANA